MDGTGSRYSYVPTTVSCTGKAYTESCAILSVYDISSRRPARAGHPWLSPALSSITSNPVTHTCTSISAI